MKPHPRVSPSGVELVKRFEGLRRKAARLADGGWTIGYGHTQSAREGAQVTAEDAEALLVYDLAKVSEALDAACFSPLNQNQADALTAFAFNIGVDAFRGSAVLKHLNAGAYLQAAAALEMWRKADFEGESLVFDALVRRRAAEKALFLTPTDGYRPAPSPVLRPTFDSSATDASDLGPAAAPVTATASLDGDLAELEIDRSVDAPPAEPEAPSESLSPGAAAAHLAARLNRLFADDPPLMPPPPRVDPTPAPPADADQVGLFLLEPEPPPPPPPVESPYLSLVSEAEPTDFPESPPPEVEPADQPEDTSHVFSGPFGRRPRPSRNVEPKQVDGYGAKLLVLGLLGLAMVFGSLLAMLGGRATLMNLAIGLVGVVCLAPIAARFLTTSLERRAGRWSEPPRHN